MNADDLPMALSEVFNGTTWIPIFRTHILPPFKMVKAKSNNKTGVNTFKNPVKTYISKGRKVLPPQYFECICDNEIQAEDIQNTINGYGIQVPTIGFTKIHIDLAQAFQLISKINGEQK